MPLSPPQIDVLARRLNHLLQTENMAELEQLLLCVGLQELCSAAAIEHCRIRGLDRLVILLAHLGRENAVEVASAERWLSLYQSTQQRQCIGSLEGLPARHVLRLALQCVWAGKNLPLSNLLPAVDIPSPRLSASATLPVGSDEEVEAAVEFLLDHDCVAAAVEITAASWKSGRIGSHQLQLARALLKRQGARRRSSEQAEQLVSLYRLIYRRLQGQPTLVSLQESMAMLVGEQLMRGRDPREALPWCEKARSTAAVLKAHYMATTVHCRTGQITQAQARMDRLLDGLLRQGCEWARTVFTAPGGNEGGKSSFNLDAARSALSDLHRVLEPIGHRPFLVSGTLLGYERVRDFLSHDKDIDVGLYGHEDCFEVLQALSASGLFNVKANGVRLQRTYNVCARHAATGMAIDIFFYHREGDRLVTGVQNDIGYLQNFAFTPFELQPIEFVGVPTWAPSDIDLNLRENFGNWQMPDPGYMSHLESPSTVDTGGEIHMLVGRLKLFEAFLKADGRMGLRVCRFLAGLNPAAGQVPSELTKRLQQHFEGLAAAAKPAPAPAPQAAMELTA